MFNQAFIQKRLSEGSASPEWGGQDCPEWGVRMKRNLQFIGEAGKPANIP